MRKLFYCTIFISLFTMVIACCFGQNTLAEENLRAEFEKRYQRWLDWVKANPYASDPTDNQIFDDIVALGPKAVPVILDKIDKNPQSVAVCLRTALILTTSKIFEYERGEETNYIKRFKIWWERYQKGLDDTPEKFKKLYSKWKALKEQGEKSGKEAKAVERIIRGLGLPALPYMVEKVEEGDADLIPMISLYTLGEINAKTKSTSDVVEWWQKNKDKWTLPKGK